MSRPFDALFDDIAHGLITLFGPWSEHVDEQEWAVEGPIGLLTVRTANGSIAIRGADQDGITATAWKTVRGPTLDMARYFAARVRMHMDHRGDNVSFYTLYPHPPLGCSVYVRYELTVPRGIDAVLFTQSGGIDVNATEGAVEAEAWNGNIRLTDSLGPAQLVTSQGAIRISGSDGSVDARSGGGTIEARDVTGHMELRTTRGDILVLRSDGVVEVRSYDGDIDLRGGRGEVALETTRGDIRATLERLEGPGMFTSKTGDVIVAVREGGASIDAESVQGSVDLRLPDGYSGQLEAGTTGGAIQCELPVDARISSSSLLLGRLGHGGSALVRARAFDGDVRLRSWQSDPSF